jgi:anti-anti-sigma regulatory factor
MESSIRGRMVTAPRRDGVDPWAAIGKHEGVAARPAMCGTTSEASSATESTQWRRTGTWPSDNELHLLIDVDRSPVLVRVSGTLDARTGINLGPVIREVIGEGHLRFDLDIDRLHIVDPRGFDALIAVRRSIVSAGGTMALVHGNRPSAEGSPSPAQLCRSKKPSRPRTGQAPAATIVGTGG